MMLGCVLFAPGQGQETITGRMQVYHTRPVEVLEVLDDCTASAQTSKLAQNIDTIIDSERYNRDSIWSDCVEGRQLFLQARLEWHLPRAETMFRLQLEKLENEARIYIQEDLFKGDLMIILRRIIRDDISAGLLNHQTYQEFQESQRLKRELDIIEKELKVVDLQEQLNRTIIKYAGLNSPEIMEMHDRLLIDHDEYTESMLVWSEFTDGRIAFLNNTYHVVAIVNEVVRDAYSTVSYNKLHYELNVLESSLLGLRSINIHDSINEFQECLNQNADMMQNTHINSMVNDFLQLLETFREQTGTAMMNAIIIGSHYI